MRLPDVFTAVFQILRRIPECAVVNGIDAHAAVIAPMPSMQVSGKIYSYPKRRFLDFRSQD
jgi:hypothetical protein